MPQNPYQASQVPQAKVVPPASPLTVTAWLICIIAAIGFAFDIYELLMLPLILRPALLELLNVTPGTPEFNYWLGMLFYVPAFAGGIFGLWGGYLTDLLGRRRVLTWSILLYAVSAFLAGYSTNIYQLLFLRCTTFIGVCIEFVAAVAWLAELFPNPQQREKVLGYTQAFSSIGGLLVAVVNGICITYGNYFPPIGIPESLSGLWGTIDPAHQHEAWRYTLMSGLIPALPLLIIRPFLPESPVWAQKRATGTLRRPSIAAIFAPELRKTTIVTTLMFACSYGAAFGAIQQMPQIVPGLTEVQAGGQAAADAAAKKLTAAGEPDKVVAARSRAASGTYTQKIAAEYTKVQEIGGLVGRFLMAYLAVIFISRRALLRVFQIPGLLFVPLLFYFFLQIPNTTFFEIPLESVFLGRLPITTMSVGMFFAGLFTVAQFSFWGNYLPLVYPVHLRGTGESFAANIGGRMIGTSFAAVTSIIAGFNWSGQAMDTWSAPLKTSLTAAGVALFVYLAGTILCSFLPEPDPHMEE
ncbi:MAG: MFS transporter [Pirellulales bacterium]|nr:MFS transporter [Pirellulales bacterium]